MWRYARRHVVQPHFSRGEFKIVYRTNVVWKIKVRK